MNCIIIEDELPAIARLEHQLAATGYEVNVLAKIDSVKKSVAWLANNAVDLIFLDIQLSDGLGFEIFDHLQIKTPVIFTTSYDKYAINAFDQNSISYLLKPIKVDRLKLAIEKYHSLYEDNTFINTQILPLNQQYQKRFLVRTGTSFYPISTEEIAYIHLQNTRFLFITTKDKRQFLYDSTLELLEKRLDPNSFFRINRQFIANYTAIAKVNHEDGRLKIEMDPEYKEELLVSINKASGFKNWLDR